MKETLIDIETYCEADIKKCGLYRYVSDPSFEILLIAWATDEGEGFGETKLADLASGDPFPKELLDDFKDSDVTLIAHNAAFERVSFSRYLQQHYPGQYLKPHVPVAGQLDMHHGHGGIADPAHGTERRR